MPIASSRTAFQKHNDVIIIGSGTAGGLVAERLTQAGRSCVMLEAGRRYSAMDFPVPESAQGSLFWRQGMEFTTDGRMMVLRGKCVGGSSVVNQALLDQASEDTLDRWAKATNVPHFADCTVPRKYVELLNSGRFRHRVIPAAANNGNARKFLAGMKNRGWTAHQLHRAEGDCGWSTGQNCIDCLGGCARRSKQSALETTLPRAEAAGLIIHERTRVLNIADIPRGVRLTVLHAGIQHKLEANTVVLAAGSLGTSELLLRSGFKASLPAIGENFYLHPQFNTFARFDEPVNGHLGAFQSVASSEPKFQARGFKLECIALPRSVMALVLPWSGTQKNCLSDYSHWACAEISVNDTEPGRIVASRRGPRTIVKPLSNEDLRKRDEGRAAITDIFASAGATEFAHGWLSISVHPMGGCAINANPRQGVTRPDFRLHGSDHIYVCDSSLFPDALGRNPSLTVMALADIATDEILDQATATHV